MEKVSVEDLSGKELINICMYNKEVRERCSSPEYNNTWIEKLRKDYNVEYFGDNAYKIYLKYLQIINH